MDQDSKHINLRNTLNALGPTSCRTHLFPLPLGVYQRTRPQSIETSYPMDGLACFRNCLAHNVSQTSTNATDSKQTLNPAINKNHRL